ncbi:sterol desaturase family protein [Saprospiraceae bacterium]|nr:sterol desaturase family protein [Saprospiraceae bacterium]
MLEYIIDYFSNISSAHRTLILVGGLTIFSLIESAVPLFSLSYKRWKHAGINIFFTLTTILVNFFMAFLLVKTADWVVSNNIGLLQWIDLPVWLFLIAGLLLMDLIGAYTPHWVEHHVTWMWKFHVIHHTDQNVDVTSANRHHPGESVIRFAFTIIATIIVGAPMWLVFLYQSMSVVLSQFNHANITLPNTLDRVLNKFIVTPNMHHVHHHYRQPYSDTNYGNIFSFWDRIFSTYIEVDNQKLKYGLDTHMDRPEANNITTMLANPFKPYRQRIDYQNDERL